MNGCTALDALEGFSRQLGKQPAIMRQIFTYDRGSEMACQAELARRLKLDIWLEVSNKCSRDQLTLMYSLKAKNVHVNFLDRKTIVNKYFRKHPHFRLKRHEKFSCNFPRAHVVIYALRKKIYRLAFVFLKRVF